MINLGNKKVSKMLIGSNVIYQDSDGWIPLTLPNGVTGLVLFRDNENGTAGLVGSLEFTTTATTYGYMSPGHLVLTPPHGYYFMDTKWLIDSENTNKMTVYGSRSDGGTPIMYTDAYLQFSEGNIYFSQISNDQSVSGKLLVLASFNQVNTTSSNNAGEGALPAIVNIKRV